MKPISFCTSSVQNTASEQRLKSSYRLKTWFFESERSLQKIVAEGTQINGLHLGKNNLLRTRLQRRLSKEFKKSLNKIKVQKQQFINLNDGSYGFVCDSKRQYKTLGRKYSKQNSGLPNSVMTSSTSPDSKIQTSINRNDGKIENRNEKYHHSQKTTGIVEPKVSVLIQHGSKKRKRMPKQKDTSQQNNMNKLEKSSFVKSLSTTSLGYEKHFKINGGENKQKKYLKRHLCNLKPKKNVTRKNKSKGSMTSSSRAKLHDMKVHIHQSNADRAPHFWTLKLKEKRKLTNQESKTLQIPAARKMHIPEETSVTDNKAYKSKQASKESKISRSSYMHKQQVRKQGSLTEIRLNQSQKVLLPTSSKKNNSTKKCPYVCSTVKRRTMSAFNLTPKYIIPTTKRVQSSIVTGKSSISNAKTGQYAKKIPKQIKSLRRVSYRKRLSEGAIESPKNERTQSVSQTRPKSRKKNNRVNLKEEYGSQGDIRLRKSIALKYNCKDNVRVGSALDRCYCTLKLQNAGKDKPRVHSNLHTEKNHGQQTEELCHEIKQIETSSRGTKSKYTRRAVKISSSFSFDIKLCGDVPLAAHRKLLLSNVENKNTKPTRSPSSHESQTEIAKKRDNITLIRPTLKRCFCTLKLREKQHKEVTERQRSKFNNVNRFTFTNTKHVSPKPRTDFKKNESVPHAARSNLKLNFNATNNETSTLHLIKPKNNCTNKPSFQVVRLSSDLSFKLMQSCKPLNQREIYAMNIYNVSQYKTNPKIPTICLSHVADTCDQKLNLRKLMSKISMGQCADVSSKSKCNVTRMLKNKSQQNDKSYLNYPKQCSIKHGVSCHKKLSHFHRQVDHIKSVFGTSIDYLKLLSSIQRKLKNSYLDRSTEPDRKYESDNVHIHSNNCHQYTRQKRNMYQYKDVKSHAVTAKEPIDVAAQITRNKGKEKQKQPTLPDKCIPITPGNHNNERDKIKQISKKHRVSHYECEPNLYFPRDTALYDSGVCNQAKQKRFNDQRSRTKITDVPTYVLTDNRPPAVMKQSLETEMPRAIKKTYTAQHKNIKNTRMIHTNDSEPEVKRNILHNNRLKYTRMRDSQILTQKIKSTVSAMNPFLKHFFNNIKMQLANDKVISDTKNPSGKEFLSAKEYFNNRVACNTSRSKKRKSLLNVVPHKNRSGIIKSSRYIPIQNEILKQKKSNRQSNIAKVDIFNDCKARLYDFDPYVYFLEKGGLYNKELLKHTKVHTATKIKPQKTQSRFKSVGQFSTNESHGKIRKTISAMNENEKIYKRNVDNNNYPISYNKIHKAKHVINRKGTRVSSIPKNESQDLKHTKNVLCAKSESITYSAPCKPTCRRDREIRYIKSQENKVSILSKLKRYFNAFKVQKDISPWLDKLASKHQNLNSSKIKKTVYIKRIARLSDNYREILNLQGENRCSLDNHLDMLKRENSRSEKSSHNCEVLTIFPYTPKKRNICSITHFLSNTDFTGVKKTLNKENENNQVTKVKVKQNIHPDSSIKTMFRCVTQFFRKCKSYTNIHFNNLNSKPEVRPICYNKTKEHFMRAEGFLKKSKSDRPVTNRRESLHKKRISVNSTKCMHYNKYRFLTDHKVKTYSRFQSGDAGTTATKPTICQQKKTNIISYSHKQITCMYCRAQYENKPIESIKVNYLDGSNPTRNITGARRVEDIKAQKLILMPACVKECNPKICETHMTRPCPCISPKIETNVKKPKRKDCCCFDQKPYCGPLPVELTEEQRRLSRKPIKPGEELPPNLPPRPLPSQRKRRFILGGGVAGMVPTSAGGTAEQGQTIDSGVGVVQPGGVPIPAGSPVGEQGQTTGGGSEIAQTGGGKDSKKKGKSKEKVKGKKKGKKVNIATNQGVQDTGTTLAVVQDTGPKNADVKEKGVKVKGVKGTGTKKGTNNVDNKQTKGIDTKDKGGTDVGQAVGTIITNAVCACDDENKLSKNPIKNYIKCVRHLNKPIPPPPPPPPPEPVEYMDPEPLFEMKLMADTMDLINPHDVMFKVQQLRSSLKYHPEELLKRLQKIHGLACRCCICVAVEQAALKKQQKLQNPKSKKKQKKASEREKKKNLEQKLALLKRNPCICGSKRCQKLLNEIATNELKLQEMKKIVPCVCGTKICAQERMKEDVKRNLITKESMKQSLREKERQKRELKQKAEYEARLERYKKEDKLRKLKRKKMEKNVTKQVKKQIGSTPDSVLACESLVDIGKLAVTTVFNALRSIYHKARHPMDTYKTLRYSYKEPGRWKSSMQSAWVDSGATSVAKRIWLRITGMQKTQELKLKINDNAAAGYFVHVFDPDEKRRLKYLKKHMALKKKGHRKREPMDYECSLFMASQRRRPYLSVYYRCPWFYPHCISLINLWRQCTDVLLFLLAVLVWSPCILCMELFRGLMCCTVCTA